MHISVKIPLPQRTLYGLRRQKCTKSGAPYGRICCEQVDSFSGVSETTPALTMFPGSFAVKAISIAIDDSLGRTIDRIIWCEVHRFFLLTDTSPNAHAGKGFGQRGQSLYGLIMQCYKVRIVLRKRFLIEIFCLWVIMLQQKCGIEIALNPAAIGHLIPTLSK